MKNLLRSLLIVSVVVVGTTEIALAQSPWQTLSNSDRSFFVDVPGVAKHTSNQVKTSTGDEYTTHVYIVETATEAYVVHTALLPESVNTSNPRINLQGGLDNAIKGMDGQKWTKVNWTSLQGLPAVDAEGMRQGYAVRAFFLLNGKRLIVLTYAGQVGSNNSDNASRFVKSLRLAR